MIESKITMSTGHGCKLKPIIFAFIFSLLKQKWLKSTAHPHLQYALYGVDSSQQVQASTEDTEHTGHDARQSHRLQHLSGSWRGQKSAFY